MRTFARAVERIIDVRTTLIDVVLGRVQAVAEQAVECTSGPNVATGIAGTIVVEMASDGRRVRTPGTASTDTTGNHAIHEIAAFCQTCRQRFWQVNPHTKSIRINLRIDYQIIHSQLYANGKTNCTRNLR